MLWFVWNFLIIFYAKHFFIFFLHTVVVCPLLSENITTKATSRSKFGLMVPEGYHPHHSRVALWQTSTSTERPEHQAAKSHLKQQGSRAPRASWSLKSFLQGYTTFNKATQEASWTDRTSNWEVFKYLRLWGTFVETITLIYRSFKHKTAT